MEMTARRNQRIGCTLRRLTQVHQQWVQQQVRQCRRIVLDKKHQAPECAVFVGPPQDKAPLRCRPPRFTVIEDQDQAQLENFLVTVRQRGPSE